MPLGVYVAYMYNCTCSIVHVTTAAAAKAAVAACIEAAECVES